MVNYKQKYILWKLKNSSGTWSFIDDLPYFPAKDHLWMIYR
jgi:hypothetical protein